MIEETREEFQESQETQEAQETQESQEQSQRDERNFSFFRFEDLRLYDKVLNYIDWVYNTTKLFPEIDDDGMAVQFRNAARSIAVNIAEGSGRTKSQFVYHLKLSKSSIRECVVLTTISNRFGYISEETMEESRRQLIELSKMLGALISSLQRNGNGSNASNNR